ncbi:MAG TPA: sugar phosphate isomerase/epimerase [Bryobacteraceae bacterium]|jgi:sugar phosphate isomerase/epimerase|nr:sugar phosphate isomerase/epimerase [Bryobacteraceae bacterium]
MTPQLSRRRILALPGALLTASAADRSIFRGVALGTQTYSFRDRPLDEAVAAMAQIGFGVCEVSGRHLEPQNLRGAELRQWRMTAPLAHFAAAGEKLRKAGIEPRVLTYNLNLTPASDSEIERGFEMARALGAKAISTSTKMSIVPAIDAAAKRNKMRVGLHNHSVLRKEEITTPDDFAAALRGRSEYMGITLDIGHFTAAGFNPAAWLREHHRQVFGLHVKDRKKDQGPNVPFGEGDTPIVQVLHYIRDHTPHIPALIEYEYSAKDTVAEVRKCFDYCRHGLLS